MPVLSPDGTIYGEEGKVLHFSIQRFVRDVVSGGCCFMCGRAESAAVPFNAEHVVPRWVLSRFGMFDQSITIPNGWDYADLTFARTSMIQVEDTVIFTVLNDSRMCEVVTRQLFSRLGPLSVVQSREVLAHLAYTKMRIHERPQYRTELDDLRNLRVNADLPKSIEMDDPIPSVFGGMLDALTRDFPVPVDREEVRRGNWTFLFDERGEFVKKSITRQEATGPT